MVEHQAGGDGDARAADVRFGGLESEGPGYAPHDLARMLRICFLQQGFNRSDPQAEDAIYDSESMRRFARVELGDDEIPDESTILRFRHRLEQNGLTEAIFEAVKDRLALRDEAPHRDGPAGDRAQRGGDPGGVRGAVCPLNIGARASGVADGRRWGGARAEVQRRPRSALEGAC
jgi:hypothetical protein